MRIQVHALASLLRASFGRMRWSALEKKRSLKMAPCLVWLGLNHISNTSRPSPAREEGALYGPGTATAVAIFSGANIMDVFLAETAGYILCETPTRPLPYGSGLGRSILAIKTSTPPPRRYRARCDQDQAFYGEGAFRLLPTTSIKA